MMSEKMVGRMTLRKIWGSIGMGIFGNEEGRQDACVSAVVAHFCEQSLHWGEQEKTPAGAEK